MVEFLKYAFWRERRRGGGTEREVSRGKDLKGGSEARRGTVFRTFATAGKSKGSRRRFELWGRRGSYLGGKHETTYRKGQTPGQRERGWGRRIS